MKDTDRGILGVLLSVITPSIEILNHYLQFAGAAFGVILVLISIWHKWLQVKAIKKRSNGQSR